MGVFCDRLKFGSTAVFDCRTGQNKGRYCKKELLLLLVLLEKLRIASGLLNYTITAIFHKIKDVSLFIRTHRKYQK